jgi:hypothetical protein
MIMTERDEQPPRPAAELEQLASYYDSHDTSAEIEHGTWVEPQPMATTSLTTRWRWRMEVCISGHSAC